MEHGRDPCHLNDGNSLFCGLQYVQNYVEIVMDHQKAVLASVFAGEMSEELLISHMERKETWLTDIGSSDQARLDTFLDALEDDSPAEDKRQFASLHAQALAACFAYAPAARMLRMVYACEQIDTDMLPRAIDGSTGVVQVLASWRYSYLRALTTMCRVFQQRHAAPNIELHIGM